MMSPVIQHIRQATAHEEAANKHEDRYEMQMKSAGASMFAAFKLALAAAPEYQGRKIDDKAIERIYQSTKPRPWWDSALKAGGVKETAGKPPRKRAAALIQWHLDPISAAGTYGAVKVMQAAAQKRLRAQRAAQTRPVTSRAKAAPSTAAMRDLHVAGQVAAAGGRSLQVVAGGKKGEGNAAASSLEELLAEVNRIQSAVRKVKPDDRAAVFEILRVTAREIEEHHA